jgi:RimJ/RimL family protein N-acetyltransferase
MVSTSHIKPYIAYLDTEPLGFIQSYVAVRCGEGWWENEVDFGILGIDQFLCDGTRLSQGLGSKMVNAFTQELFTDPSVTTVQTDPNPKNARAIRCYEKAGFQAVREVSTPDGPALLMAIVKASRLRSKTSDS